MKRNLQIGVVLASAVIGLGACGGDDNETDGGEEFSATELSSSLPTADELGLENAVEGEWFEAEDFVIRGIVVGGDTSAEDLALKLEDAGFEGAVGLEVSGQNPNVRVRAIQFSSGEGALDARDLLHEEDLKTPCPEACIVTPVDYDVETVPEAVAAHHVPTQVDPPSGQPVEANHGEFVEGSTLYVVQMDGKPSPDFTEGFDQVMETVYDTTAG